MICKSLTNVAEKSPWRVPLPLLGRTLVMGDIVHTLAGAGVGVLISLPLFRIAPLSLPLMLIVLFGFLGFLTKRMSPRNMGWRNYMSGKFSHHFKSMATIRTEKAKRGSRGKYVLYHSPNRWMFIIPSEKYISRIEHRHIRVHEDYILRDN